MHLSGLMESVLLVGRQLSKKLFQEKVRLCFLIARSSMRSSRVRVGWIFSGVKYWRAGTWTERGDRRSNIYRPLVSVSHFLPGESKSILYQATSWTWSKIKAETIRGLFFSWLCWKTPRRTSRRLYPRTISLMSTEVRLENEASSRVGKIGFIFGTQL